MSNHQHHYWFTSLVVKCGCGKPATHQLNGSDASSIRCCEACARKRVEMIEASPNQRMHPGIPNPFDGVSNG